MRNLKAFGLCLMAALAVSAVAAPASFADEFTAEESPTLLTGRLDPESAEKFQMTVGAATCNTTTYTATLTGATTKISVTPDFSDSGCSVAGLPSTVHTNGCTYLFNVEGGASTLGDLDLVCPAGSEITVTAPASPTVRCTLHFKPQSDIAGSIKYTNVGAGATREITVEANLSGIDYTHTKGSGLGSCLTGSATNGLMTTKVILTGENHAGTKHIGIFMSSV